MQAEQYDVAIVGYGPVGQLLAALLGRDGWRVLVVEKHGNLYGKPRAGHCDGETMRTFQSLGIAEELERLLRPITSYELVSPDWTVLQRVAIGQSGAGWKASYLFHQPQLEEILDAAARRHANVQLHMGLEVRALRQAGSFVDLVAAPREKAGAGAGERTFRARYVVGTDGARSFVRESLGLPRTDLGFAPYEFLVIDFEQKNPDIELPAMGEVRQVLDPRRPTTAGRWNGNRWSRWEFMRMPGESIADMEAESTCWKLLAPWGVGPEDGRIERRTVYRFESQLADRWRDARVFIAGDAAHTMPPFMAQGLCSGFRDALNLSWKLGMVLRGDASDALLDSYETERKPHVESIIRLAMHIGELVTVTDEAKARQRDEALLSGKLDLPHGFPVLERGLLARDAPLAGHPAPQARVCRQGRSGRFDDVAGRGWRIVTRRAFDNALLAHRRGLLDFLGMEVAHVTRGCLDASYLDIDAEYSLWFQAHGVEAFVQRPDFYIYGAVRRVAELPGLLDSLDAQLSPMRTDRPARHAAA